MGVSAFIALLLLYDITSKSSFDNIRVSLGRVHRLQKDEKEQDGTNRNEIRDNVLGGFCPFFGAVLPNVMSSSSCLVDLFACLFLLFQAWLTEIHEYAQSDVVIMLLGNKVRGKIFISF